MYKVQEPRNIKYFILHCSSYPLPSCQGPAASTVSHVFCFSGIASRGVFFFSKYLFGCACSIFSMGTLSCGMWVLVSWQEIELRPLQWECRVLAPGSGEMAQNVILWTQATMNIYLFFTPHVVLVVKNPPPCAGDIRDSDSIPGSRRSSGAGNGNPLWYPCLEHHHGQRSPVGYSP